MLIAVSCLSPVKTQILIFAFDRLAIVSGTPSWKYKITNAAELSKYRRLHQDDNRLLPAFMLKLQISQYFLLREVFAASVKFR